jgi:hypothetical protein
LEDKLTESVAFGGLKDKLARFRSDLAVFEVFLGNRCPDPLPAGVNGLWTINLLKNEPLQTTSVTKLLCDSW